MAIDRDAIFQALHDRLREKLKTKIVKFSRRLVAIDQARKVEQPLLCVVAVKDSPQAQRGLPTVHRLQAGLLLYNIEKLDDPETPQLKLVDAIEKALERTEDEPLTTNTSAGAFTTTLGGLVEYCNIVGDLEFYQGADGDQAVALIQVELLALNNP
jgi:hypothetical protein